MGILSELIKPITDLVGKAVVDKDKARELNVRLQELADKSDARLHEELMGQIEVNKQEAAHPSIFVAGWRPFVGWSCGFGVAWTFVASPFVVQIAKFFGYAGEPVAVDTATLLSLLMGMLGISGMRTYEKYKGVATSGINKADRK